MPDQTLLHLRDRYEVLMADVSLDDVTDTKHEQVWNAEIERRVIEINVGKAKGRPAEELLAEIRAKYS